MSLLKTLGEPLVPAPGALVLHEGDAGYRAFQLSPEAIRDIEEIEMQMRLSARRLRDIWLD